MTQEEITALINAVTKGGDTLANYVKGLKPVEAPAITLDGVTKFLTENEDGKKYMQSTTDKRVTDGINTAMEKFKKEKLPGLVEDEYKKKYPDADPKDKALKDLQDKIAKMEKDNVRKDLTNKALKALTTKGLPSDMVDKLIGDDEDSTNKAIDAFASMISKHDEAMKTEFAKKNGYKPPKEDHKPTDEETKALEAAKATMEKTMGIKF